MKKLLWTKYKVIKTIWPFNDGWGTYREHIVTGQRQIVDTGLPYQQAVDAAAELNEQNNTKSNSK